ncbi:hypothetical protein ACFL6E_01730 [Candidatus Neomarinimicrobiota bacterium]
MRIKTGTIRSALYLALGATMLLGGLTPLFGQDEAGEEVEAKRRPKLVTQRQFYEMQLSMEELRRQMNQLRIDVAAAKSREMTPDIYRLILKKIKPTVLTHEIELTNGTLVRGNIIKEDMNELTLETSLGALTLEKSTIRSINKVAGLLAAIDFVGDAREEIYDDHRVYTGEVVNNGIIRSDFTRVIFRLWSADAKELAVDSSFVDGAGMAYLSGVVTDTAIEPNQTVPYQVKVRVAKDAMVNYITREIRWEQFD